MNRVVGHLVVGCGALAATLVAGAVRPAHAATVVVNTTVDAAVGGCETTGTGPNCTLRQAVRYANDHPGTVIELPEGLFYLTVQAPSPEGLAMTGDLDIRESTTINGVADKTVIIAKADGGNSDRVFDIYPSGDPISVAISGVVIAGGHAHDTYGGAGMWIGLGASVTLSASQINVNMSDDGRGGGIAVSGASTKLVVNGSSFNGNYAAPTAAGADASGGAIDVTDGTVEIVNTRFAQNVAQAAPGGASASNVMGGDSAGGAVSARGTSTLTIRSSAFIMNESIAGAGAAGTGFEAEGGDAHGGGLIAELQAAAVNIANNTFSGNRAQGGAGAAGGFGQAGSAFGGGAMTEGPSSIINNSFAGNVAAPGAKNAAPQSGISSAGGLQVLSSQSQVANNVIALNSLEPPSAANAPDLSTNSDLDHNNLIGIWNSFGRVGPSDLVGTPLQPLDPEFDGAIGDHGGPTATIALASGSPAINAGAADACALAGNVDQRGLPRPNPAGGRCDIGAFEYTFAPTNLVLTSSANPAAVGQAVTFTATLSASAGAPTGIITVKDGGTSIGGGAIAGGVVTVTTAALSGGAHSMTAEYSGDDVFAPSVAALSQVVGDSGGQSGLQFYPLPRPVRLLDTRPAHPAFVQPGVPLVANQPLTLPGRVTIDGVMIPASAKALVGNATVDNTGGVPPGFATLWPSGSSLPLASNLNFVPGTVRPNSFTVGLGADGQFNLLSNTGGHFIVDITGYFAPPGAGGLYFHPLPQPVRLLDTRPGATAVVGPGSALSAGQTLNLPGHFAAATTTVPSTARALVGNATVDNTVNAPPGFATLFPGGTPLPPTSNLNFAGGTIAPNAFTVGLGDDGSFNLYSNTGGNFVVDVTGYYDAVPTGGLLFTALSQPVRELDTRVGFAAVVHPDAPVAAGSTINLPGSFTSGAITVPSTAAALVGNATVDNSIGAPAGFATLFPGGGELPLASNLNYAPGLIAPNAFVVGIGAGSYNLFSQSTTNYIIDISGYFAAT